MSEIMQILPYRLEYSAKDEKFHLLATGKRKPYMINLARIYACELMDSCLPAGFHLPRKRQRELALLLHDERSALERVLLHFSHLEKETQKLDDRLDRQLRILHKKKGAPCKTVNTVFSSPWRRQLC